VPLDLFGCLHNLLDVAIQRIQRFILRDWVFNGYFGCDLAVVVVDLENRDDLANRWHHVQAVNLLKTELASFDEHELAVKVGHLQTVYFTADLDVLTYSHLHGLRGEVVVDLDFLLLRCEVRDFLGYFFLYKHFVFGLLLLEMLKGLQFIRCGCILQL